LQLKAQDIPAADLCKMLSQCQWPDKPSVMNNKVEYVAKLNDVMYQYWSWCQRWCRRVRHMAYW
jgi:hypothetical protein